MIAINHDPSVHDEARRHTAYTGDLFVDSPTAQSAAFCEFAREMIGDAFAGRDPETAQYDVDVSTYVDILAELKPRFIHHERSRMFVRAMLDERGCDLDRTYLDVPRLRSSTSDGYLTTGIALAWHPHRDTWYSAPQTQLNLWMPVYDLSSGNAMAFHLDYFDRGVPNSSDTYNYYEWNQKYRRSAASQVGGDTRPLPGPTVDIDLTNSLVPVAPVGAVTTFSGHHLHSSVPNTTGCTRFSIDFRTVNLDDIEGGLGAPNVDAHCTGSSIRDFIRASDFAPMPDEIVRRFDDGSEADGELLYSENVADRA
ncbi:MAG: hypothetical protein QNM02_18755 [Acidimicrobiia bacterium]|nr:hypothetical protein [Acidimicrobiia bacterium]